LHAHAQVAAAEMARFLADKRTFEALHRQYSALHYAAQQAGARARAGLAFDSALD
jgi:hypothetical protein